MTIKKPKKNVEELEAEVGLDLVEQAKKKKTLRRNKAKVRWEKSASRLADHLDAHRGTKEQSLMSQYLEDLDVLYRGHICLVEGQTLPREKISLWHKCSFCGSRFTAKPSTMRKGQGCKVCKTSATHIEDLENHIEKADAIHDKRFLLVPRLLPHFSYKTGHTYRCRVCNDQIRIKPKQLEDKENIYRCQTCTELSMYTENNKRYALRLEELYGQQRIHLIQKFHSTKALKHRCSRQVKPHIFESTVIDLLRGKGCPRCEMTQNLQTQISGFIRRGRKFHLVKQTEREALLTAIKQAGGMRNLQTTYSHPIPSIRNRIPSFFDVGKQMLIDVYNGNVRKREVKIRKDIKAAKKQNLRYGIIAINAKGIEFKDDEHLLRIFDKLNQRDASAKKRRLDKSLADNKPAGFLI